MTSRSLLVIALGLGMIACKKDSAVPAAGSFECADDTDCRLSCVPRDGCCEACDCSIAYHRDELTKVRQAYRTRCDGNFCQRSCPAPTATWVPVCQNGACAARAQERAAPTPPPPPTPDAAASRPEAPATPTATPRFYRACGCGCCGGSGSDPKEAKCVSEKKMAEIVAADQQAARQPHCAVAGCSLGTPYRVCP